MKYSASASDSYRKIYSINLGRQPIKNKLLDTGVKKITIEGNENVILEGTLQETGVLSGLAWLYGNYEIKGQSIEYEIIDKAGESYIQLILPTVDIPKIVSLIETEEDEENRSVFERKRLKHLHFEAFDPTNLANWTPQNETDIYMAFGVLQDNTQYRYCCGTSQDILNQLKYTAENKPDAILIDRITREYKIAEWKMKSSDFKKNHRKDDIDVLICWIDDESCKSLLPLSVVPLRDVARMAAMSFFGNIV